MSIKSTQHLTRKEAESLYRSFRMQQHESALQRRFSYELEALNDEQLGDKLDEITTDKFSNYLVGVEE